MATAKRATKHTRAKRPGKMLVEVGPVRKKRPAGRERMNLMVDRELLERVAVTFGTTNKSEAVHRALAQVEENERIVEGLNAALGAIPDFPYLDT